MRALTFLCTKNVLHCVDFTSTGSVRRNRSGVFSHGFEKRQAIRILTPTTARARTDFASLRCRGTACMWRQAIYNPPVELPSSSASNFFEEAGAGLSAADLLASTVVLFLCRMLSRSFGNKPEKAECSRRPGEAEETEARRKFNKFCTQPDGSEPKAHLTYDSFCRLVAHYEAASSSMVQSYFYAIDRDLDQIGSAGCVGVWACWKLHPSAQKLRQARQHDRLRRVFPGCCGGRSDVPCKKLGGTLLRSRHEESKLFIEDSAHTQFLHWESLGRNTQAS